MKKVILIMTTLALGGMSAQTALAGGRHCGGGGWGTAAAVIGGVTAGLIVSHALASPAPCYVAPTPVYYPPPPPPPVVVCPPPAPVVYAPAPAVVVYRPPVCAAPPAVRVSFGYGWHRHGCR